MSYLAPGIPARRLTPFGILMRNAAEHFQLRKMSWFMAFATFGAGVILTINTTLFSGPGGKVYFAFLVGIAGQPVWRALFLVIGTSRILALFINGSFPGVWWTPHVRMVMSAISAALWLQVAWSVASTDVATFGTIAYPLIFFIEIDNMVLATKESRRGRVGGKH